MFRTKELNRSTGTAEAAQPSGWQRSNTGTGAGTGNEREKRGKEDVVGRLVRHDRQSYMDLRTRRDQRSRHNFLR